MQLRVVSLKHKAPISLAELLSDLLKLPFHKIKTTECTPLVQLLLRQSLKEQREALASNAYNVHVSVFLFLPDQPEHL